MFLAGVFPSFIFGILLFFIPRSPRWLMKVNLEDEARRVIELVNPEADVDEMISSIRESLVFESKYKNISIFKKPYLKLVIIGLAIGMFNQLAGINVIMYYSTDIFRDAGFSAESALLQSVLIGFTNLIFTIIAMTLIDKFGRKFLLYIGAAGISVFLGLFSWAFISGNTTGFILVSLLIGYIAFFAFSQGAVIWVILSEMFPTNIRARGTAIGSFSHWIFNFAIALLFPVVSAKTGVGWVFVFFTIATLLSLIFYRYALVETKGKSLEEIEKIMLH
jgi:sugar porter (SP) family MFS transporter